MNRSTVQSGNYFVPFYVDAKLFCVWDADLSAHNRRFIRGFDPDYFEGLARMVDAAPTDISETLLTTAARSFYCHALEKCFALTFAGLQAP